MRNVWRTALLLTFLCPTFAIAAADSKLSVELNTAETAKDRCLLTFVVENKNNMPVESLKLDLVVFNREGRMHRRMVTEMGPIRADKTIVKSFSVDGDCGEIRSILLNDITACTPGDAGACLDGINLSSRVENVRLYK
jgi:hypothetical protein